MPNKSQPVKISKGSYYELRWLGIDMVDESGWYLFRRGEAVYAPEFDRGFKKIDEAIAAAHRWIDTKRIIPKEMS